MFSISSVERKQYVFHGAIAYGRTVVSFSVKLLPTNSRNLLNFLWDNSQNVADDQHGHTNTALASEKEVYCFTYTINRLHKEFKLIGPVY